MRTNIVIDDELLAQAMDLSGMGTKKEVVNHALRLFVAMKRQEALKNWRGKLPWDENLDLSRQ